VFTQKVSYRNTTVCFSHHYRNTKVSILNTHHPTLCTAHFFKFYSAAVFLSLYIIFSSNSGTHFWREHSYRVAEAE
jgi:hypothetical protein